MKNMKKILLLVIAAQSFSVCQPALKHHKHTQDPHRLTRALPDNVLYQDEMDIPDLPAMHRGFSMPVAKRVVARGSYTTIVRNSPPSKFTNSRR